VVTVDTLQVACGGCGTVHRIIEERGKFRVTALSGPVRAGRTQMVRDVSGEEIELIQWFAESEWLPIGQYSGGIAAVQKLPCSHCGCVGKMLPFEVLRPPGGSITGASRWDECPLCHGPMECIEVKDAI
jgi:hypothetical protein